MAFNTENFKDIYPFKNNYFNHGEFKQHYVDEGQGEPILMVHGNPSWSFLYRDMIKAFRDTHRMIAPDHIGCGLSDKPAKTNFPYQLKNHIDNLEKLVKSLNLTQKITLVIHDWGGAIGMGFAVRNPEMIKRLVILNTAAFRLPSDCPFPWPIWGFRHTKFGPWFNTNFNAFSWIASHTCSIKGMSPKIKEGFRAPYDCPENRVATTQFVLDIPLGPKHESWNELMKIEKGLEKFQQTPAIICFGRKDFCFSRPFYNEWKRKLPNAYAHSFHAGHYVLEDAGDEIFDLMQDFFKANP